MGGGALATAEPPPPRVSAPGTSPTSLHNPSLVICPCRLRADTLKRV